MNVIDRMKDRLQGRWVKGTWRDENSNVCLMGAYRSVAQNRDSKGRYRPGNKSKALQYIKAVIIREYPDRLTDRSKIGDLERIKEKWQPNSVIMTFNDHAKTTEKDVIRVLEKASADMDEWPDGA